MHWNHADFFVLLQPHEAGLKERCGNKLVVIVVNKNMKSSIEQYILLKICAKPARKCSLPKLCFICTFRSTDPAGYFKIENDHNFKQSYRLLCDRTHDNLEDL